MYRYRLGLVTASQQFWEAIPVLVKQNAPFVRRRNADGTVDSICTVSFMTVATAEEESELREMEGLHTCGRLYSKSDFRIS
jgi:hypothetical protein